MADDVLTQAELETLLNALNPDAAPPAANVESVLAAQAPRSATSGPTSKPRDKAQAYDFKRPERVSKEQIRALETLHDAFSRSFASALSAVLRALVEVKLTSVDQLTYSEFTFGLENPSCLNVLRAAPLEDRLVLDISPTILYPIIDRLLGGGREPSTVAPRPLTEIELRLVSRITRLFLDELQRAWRNVLDMQLAVERVESNPQLVQVVPPNEVVVSIGFELSIGETRGMINLCIPFQCLEPIGGKLSHTGWASYGRGRASRESVAQLSGSLQQSVVELVVRLAETKISTGDMLNLRVGDIITTEKDQHGPIAVCLEGVEKFRGKPGQLKGRKAIRIEESLGTSTPNSSQK
jgi:flagellar motor switch protein FliM